MNNDDMIIVEKVKSFCDTYGMNEHEFFMILNNDDTVAMFEELLENMVEDNE